MTTKKKLLTALSMFALVAVVAAVSVGITFAALSGQVTSQFKISYTASNVEAELQAKYSTDGGKTYTAIEVNGAGDGDNHTIKFEKTTETAQNSKSFKDTTNLNFKDKENFLVIAFYFKNTSTSSNKLDITPKFTPTTSDAEGKKNVTVTYSWLDSETGGVSGFDTFSTPSPINTDITSNFTNAEELDAEVEAILFVKVEITEEIKDATFAGTFTFDLKNASEAV